MGFCFLVISVSSVCLPERLFVTISSAAQNVYPSAVTPFGAGVVTGIRPCVFFLEYTSGGEVNREGEDEERVEGGSNENRAKCKLSRTKLRLALPTHPDGFEEVKVGQEVALRPI